MRNVKKAECIYMPNCILGEGCMWNEQEEQLYFIDIEAGVIYALDPDGLAGKAGDVTARMYRQDGRTGCLVFHRDGGLVAAVTDRLVYQDLSGGRREILLRQDFPGTIRYNDGKCDRYGNLWVGTMAVSQDLPGARGCGSLYCIRKGQVAAEYPGYTIPNGMDWNEDGSVFYHIDTALRRIDAWEVEDQICLKNRRPIVLVPEGEGDPDGMCADENGNLWTAMWGGSKVVCFESSTGRKLEEVAVPEPFVSCCCFGGRDGRSLFITTARGADGTGGQIYRAEVGVKGGRRYRYGEEA